MPDLDDAGATAARRPGAASGTAPSRRSVLRAAAGAGAAGIAASALAQVAIGAATTTPASASQSADARDAAPQSEAVVVHVRDAAAGEIDVFRGATQTRVHDKALAARIVRASR